MSEEKVSSTIVKVMREVDAVTKGRNNSAQGYKFRGVDDVYNELHAIMAKHGLFTIPRVVGEASEERTTKSGGVSIYRLLRIEFDFVNESGDTLTAGPFIGEGMDSGDKASNKAHSVAHKYALIQVFMIPTEDEKDPENQSPELKPREPQTRPPVTQPITPSAPSFVQSVEHMTPEGKKPYFVVVFRTGNKASTFSETIATTARQAQAEGVPVRVTVEKNGNFTNLKTLEIA